jgi:multicomponent K+:H+ antiporter subunit A
LASISRIAIRAGETVNVEPFDIQPDEEQTEGAR